MRHNKITKDATQRDLRITDSVRSYTVYSTVIKTTHPKVGDAEMERGQKSHQKGQEANHLPFGQ